MSIVIRTRDQYEQYLELYSIHTHDYKKNICTSLDQTEVINLELYCAVCNKTTSYSIDKMQSHSYEPNYRERVFCSSCKLNSRWRAIIETYEFLYGKSRTQIYIAEASTLLFHTFVSKFGQFASIYGSEFLGANIIPGEIQNGIRHEDLQDLSFPDKKFDLVITNDVLEHVANLDEVLWEIVRVLKPGGRHLFTIPFYSQLEHSRIRAKILNGNIVHVLEPTYHANPIDKGGGSLVYTDFGWDILERLVQVGFSDAFVFPYQQTCAGHIGGNEIAFMAIR